MNNYVMHGIARMAEVLRGDPGAQGLVTGNGGYLTKHAFCVYSTEPPERPFAHEDLQAQVDALPKRGVAQDHAGDVAIEAYSVMYGADGEPEIGHAALRLPDGRRAWGNVTDRDRRGRDDARGVLRPRRGLAADGDVDVLVARTAARRAGLASAQCSRDVRVGAASLRDRGGESATPERLPVASRTRATAISDAGRMSIARPLQTSPRSGIDTPPLRRGVAGSGADHPSTAVARCRECSTVIRRSAADAA